jgi:transcriptional regulator with XRE-family HTH domain
MFTTQQHNSSKHMYSSKIFFMSNTTFIDRFKKILEHYNYSAYRLAKETAVTNSATLNLLSGRNTPSFEYLNRLSKLFPELNLNWLVLGEETMFRDPIVRPKSSESFAPDLLESKNALISVLNENIRMKDEKIDELTAELREYRAAAKLLETAKKEMGVSTVKQGK